MHYVGICGVWMSYNKVTQMNHHSDVFALLSRIAHEPFLEFFMQSAPCYLILHINTDFFPRDFSYNSPSSIITCYFLILFAFVSYSSLKNLCYNLFISPHCLNSTRMKTAQAHGIGLFTDIMSHLTRYLPQAGAQ